VKRDRVLRDRGRLPREPADLTRLRVVLSRLDLARVEGSACLPPGIGHVGAVAVVAQRHPVHGEVSPARSRAGFFGSVTSIASDRLKRRARRVEGLAVDREAALVTEPRDRRPAPGAGGVAAVRVDGRRSRNIPGLGREVCRSPRRAARASRSGSATRAATASAAAVSVSVCTGCGRIRHVEHRDALGARARVERVEREHEAWCRRKAHSCPHGGRCTGRP